MERAEIFIGASPLQSMAASGGALITKRASRGALLIQKPGILAERHRGKPARRLRDLPIGACCQLPNRQHSQSSQLATLVQTRGGRDRNRPRRDHRRRPTEG